MLKRMSETTIKDWSKKVKIQIASQVSFGLPPIVKVPKLEIIASELWAWFT